MEPTAGRSANSAFDTNKMRIFGALVSFNWNKLLPLKSSFSLVARRVPAVSVPVWLTEI